MASVVEICNMALAQIRSSSINSLNESSVQAQQCSLHYNIARDQVLTDANWGFNQSIVALAELSSVSIFGWGHVWQYPSDCLFINQLIRNLEDPEVGTGSLVAARLYDHRFRRPQDLPQVEYKLFYNDGNRVIATKEDDLRIDYRVKVTDPNLFPAHFRVAVSYLLASYIALPLVGVKDGRQLRTDCLALYNAFKNEAMDDNANQQFMDEMPSEYITARE